MSDTEMESVVARYPRLRNLLGKIPDMVVRKELLPSVRAYEAPLPRARRTIPVVNLSDVLPGEAERGRVELENFLGLWGIRERGGAVQDLPSRVLAAPERLGLAGLNALLDSSVRVLGVLTRFDLAQEDPFLNLVHERATAEALVVSLS